MLLSDTKYGFRGAQNGISLNLVRASYEPDPYPEYGVHNIRIGVAAVDNVENRTLFRAAAEYVHPVSACSARAGKGGLPMDGHLLTVDGNVHVSAIKTPEDVDGLLIRLSDATGKGAEFKLTFARALSAAHETDINENVVKDLAFEGRELCSSVEPFGVKTIVVCF